MLICPVCKSEYQEGYKVCSDCKSELIEIPDVIKKTKPAKEEAKRQSIIGMLATTLFVIGLLLILYSPTISYQFTIDYFIPNGNGTYNPDYLIWMLKASHTSFLLAGSIICLPFIIFCIKKLNCK